MPPEEVFLRLNDTELSQSKLVAVSREIAERLTREPGIEVVLSDSRGPKGRKGDPITIGAIVLSIVGSRGAIASLVGVLKAYIERKPTLTFEFQRGDAKVTVRAENLESRQLDRTGKMLSRLIDAES
jgi:hypothetical protein